MAYEYDRETSPAGEALIGKQYARDVSLRARINEQKKYHEAELTKLKEIEQFLTEHPEFEKFQDLVTKARL